MAIPNLTSGPLAAYLVVGLFIVTTVFFVLNKLGFVRNEESEPDQGGDVARAGESGDGTADADKEERE